MGCYDCFTSLFWNLDFFFHIQQNTNSIYIGISVLLLEGTSPFFFKLTRLPHETFLELLCSFGFLYHWDNFSQAVNLYHWNSIYYRIIDNFINEMLSPHHILLFSIAQIMSYPTFFCKIFCYMICELINWWINVLIK